MITSFLCNDFLRVVSTDVLEIKYWGNNSFEIGEGNMSPKANGHQSSVFPEINCRAAGVSQCSTAHGFGVRSSLMVGYLLWSRYTSFLGMVWSPGLAYLQQSLHVPFQVLTCTTLIQPLQTPCLAPLMGDSLSDTHCTQTGVAFLREPQSPFLLRLSPSELGGHILRSSH